MTFAADLRAYLQEFEDNDDLYSIENFWDSLRNPHTASPSVGEWKLTLVNEWGGTEHDDLNVVFKAETDQQGGTYLAEVGYDSYEFWGFEYTLYEAESYEFTETRYKKVARAR